MTPLRRALVVDDNPAITRALTRLLKSHGYDCLVAHDPTTASMKLRQWRPALVISDYDLGAASTGIDLLEEAATVVPGATRLLLTGTDRIELPPLPSGVSYLPKPASWPELRSFLESTTTSPHHA